MTKITYINTMPYAYEPEINHHSPFRPNYQTNYKNRGEILESIAKYFRHIYTDVNPNTSWKDGSDIENEHASVKASEGSLGRSIGGRFNSASDKIKTYFRETPSQIFIWMEWDRDTELVTEYQMNKREFGAFIQRFTRICNNSNHTDIDVRFRKTSKRMIAWLEEQCAS